MKRALVLLLLSVICFGCATFTSEEKVAAGLVVADLATTAYGLEHGHKEINPLLRGGSTEEVLAKTLVLNVAMHWIQHKIFSKYTTSMQKKYWRIVIGIKAVPVAWNIKELSK